MHDQRFFDVIEAAPLVSVDLVVVRDGMVLLGFRNNRPAQGTWFVSGGRIRKNERITAALARVEERKAGKGPGSRYVSCCHKQF